MGVGRDRLEGACAQSEETQGAVDGGVALAVGDDPHPRAPEQPLAFDVPAGLGQHVMTRRGEGDGVGTLAAGNEAERSTGRQAEQFLQPTTGHVLDDRGTRRGDAVEGRLVPSDGQHFSCRRGIQRAAYHEPEITGTGRGYQGRLDGTGKRVDHRCCRDGPIRQGADSLSQGIEVDPVREHRLLGDFRTIVRGPRRGIGQQLEKRIHTVIIPRRHELADGSSSSSRGRSPVVHSSEPGSTPVPPRALLA